MGKVLLGGIICGIVAVLVFHQGMTLVLHQNLPLMNLVMTVPEGLRPTDPGYSVRLVPPLMLPSILFLCFWGAAWGVLLAALIHFVQLPDLAAGFFLGAVVCTLVGFNHEPGIRPVPYWDAEFLPLWIQTSLINGAWGWGAAGLMRPFGVPLDRAWTRPR